jgi:hypothetical protein
MQMALIRWLVSRDVMLLLRNQVRRPQAVAGILIFKIEVTLFLPDGIMSAL